MNPQRSPEQSAAVHPPVPVIIWEDIFVMVDQGAMRALDYGKIEAMGRDLIARTRTGVAALVIIPSVAKPPPEEVRKAISGLLSRVSRDLRCVCWLVEGSGFRAAAVRAALTGLQLVTKSPYPTHVSSSLGEALAWIMPHMVDGSARLDSVSEAASAISHGRRSLVPQPMST